MSQIETTVVTTEAITAETIAAVAETIQTVDAVTEAAPAATEAAPKTPSKKSRALEIFQAKMAERAAGVYPTNREFRAAVLTTIQAELEVSVASAATMYNSAKKDAEAADPEVHLGRDPKKEVVKVSTGKRGRPAGSKNKPKTVVVDAAVTEPAAEAATNTVTEPVNEVIEVAGPVEEVTQETVTA